MEEIRVGDTFTNYKEVSEKLEVLKKASGASFYIADSRTLKAAKSRVPNRVEVTSSDLVYYYVKLVCIHGGTFRKKKNCMGIRKTSSSKQDCPAYIYFRSTSDGKFLEVKSLCLTHNHEISPDLAKRLPRERRLEQTTQLIANEKLVPHKSLNETETFGESPEEITTENCNDERTSLEPENCTTPQIDVSTESDIATYAHKLIDFMKELGNGGESSSQATIRSLELELKKQKWLHHKEVVKIKHNNDLFLLELRASLEIDKDKALSELKKKYYIEKSRAIKELKRKFNDERRAIEQKNNHQIQENKKRQWCANCQKEAIYYCCWNTSYCDYSCQEAQWASHQESCAQLQGNNLVDIPESKNIAIPKPSLFVNPLQVAKSSTVQYMPNQASWYRIMAPGETVTPAILPELHSPSST